MTDAPPQNQEPVAAARQPLLRRLSSVVPSVGKVGIVVISVVFSALVSSGLSYFVTTQVNAEKDQHDFAQREILNFIDSAFQFNTFVAAFAFDATDKKEFGGQSKKDLIQNLNQQLALSKQLELLVRNKNSVRTLIDEYQSNVITMLGQLQNVDSVDKMGPFWSSASKLLVARNKLAPTLRNSVLNNS